MTTTIAEGCASILIESDYFNTDNQSVTLNITTNCNEEYVHDILVTDTDITVDPSLVDSEEDSLTDGIYYLVLTIIQEDGTEVVESKCVLVNCNMACDMLDTAVLASQGDCEALTRLLAYKALILAQNCTSCACADLCTLYKATKLIDCHVTKPCGCS